MIGRKTAYLILCLCLTELCSSFQVQGPTRHSRLLSLYAEKEGGWTKKILNPLKEVSDMVSKMDDVIDDFMGKKMGNGELFYGKRKYKPSGRENTEGSYNGMGHSDSARIERARERKEYLAMKRAREQQLKRDAN